jgi:hypothetical protein
VRRKFLIVHRAIIGRIIDVNVGSLNNNQHLFLTSQKT